MRKSGQRHSSSELNASITSGKSVSMESLARCQRGMAIRIAELELRLDEKDAACAMQRVKDATRRLHRVKRGLDSDSELYDTTDDESQHQHKSGLPQSANEAVDCFLQAHRDSPEFITSMCTLLSQIITKDERDTIRDALTAILAAEQRAEATVLQHKHQQTLFTQKPRDDELFSHVSDEPQQDSDEPFNEFDDNLDDLDEDGQSVSSAPDLFISGVCISSCAQLPTITSAFTSSAMGSFQHVHVQDIDEPAVALMKSPPAVRRVSISSASPPSVITYSTPLSHNGVTVSAFAGTSTPPSPTGVSGRSFSAALQRSSPKRLSPQSPSMTQMLSPSHQTATSPHSQAKSPILQLMSSQRLHQRSAVPPLQPQAQKFYVPVSPEQQGQAPQIISAFTEEEVTLDDLPDTFGLPASSLAQLRVLAQREQQGELEALAASFVGAHDGLVGDPDGDIHPDAHPVMAGSFVPQAAGQYSRSSASSQYTPPLPC
eukprot:TRINITY_DN8586_c0_g2_i2.p1 TRINITY_DN8586_c0_g2~~TRINITY_DN8586_c0_g2_i2.p1  ORF type:complete len:487 (+),score=98.27 TRINITY_DN8586_c0_g2_i2:921-2381(+)